MELRVPPSHKHDAGAYKQNIFRFCSSNASAMFTMKCAAGYSRIRWDEDALEWEKKTIVHVPRGLIGGTFERLQRMSVKP